MPAFTHRDTFGPLQQLGEDDAKQTQTPVSTGWQAAGGSAFVLQPPDAASRVELDTVSADVAADPTVNLTARVGYTTQEGDAAESEVTIIGSRALTTGQGACTSNDFQAKSVASTFRGSWGATVTVRFYVQVTSTAGSTICTRNRRVQGRFVTRRLAGDAFGGAF